MRIEIEGREQERRHQGNNHSGRFPLDNIRKRMTRREGGEELGSKSDGTGKVGFRGRLLLRVVGIRRCEGGKRLLIGMLVKNMAVRGGGVRWLRVGKARVARQIAERRTTRQRRESL